ncbi:methyltransferase domain-containing protein [bacterium]|nr:methyltransferase domain-containing protein [bacterium]
MSKHSKKHLYTTKQHQKFLEDVIIFFREHSDLNQKPFPIIHSIKYRIKENSSIQEKIKRKILNGVSISEENFYSEITDIAGVRILHIYQEQFINIHLAIVEQIKKGVWCFVEPPKAYTWDPESVIFYKNLGIETENRETYYTSIHYLIHKPEEPTTLCEIQVRTLFEEIWGEIDHSINYPYPTESLACREQLRVLSKLVSTGTRLADSIFKSFSEYTKMKERERHFMASWDLKEIALTNFIPRIFSNIWELGSDPDIAIEILIRNGCNPFIKTALDLGCGKGAILIQLARKFGITGLGVDLISEFVDEARKYARRYGVSSKLRFEVEDILRTVTLSSDYDLVTYSFDSEALGDLKKTLQMLSSTIKAGGYILLDIVYSPKNETQIEDTITEEELELQIDESSLLLIDKQVWSREKIKEVNHKSNQLIFRQIELLAEEYPENRALFEQYTIDLVKECRVTEETLLCSTILFQKIF